MVESNDAAVEALFREHWFHGGGDTCECGYWAEFDSVKRHHLEDALAAAGVVPATEPGGLTEAERRVLLAAWPWPREAATTATGFADVIAAVERILAARAVPAHNNLADKVDVPAIVAAARGQSPSEYRDECGGNRARWETAVRALLGEGSDADPLDVLCSECGHARHYGLACDGDGCTCRREPHRITEATVEVRDV